MLNPAKSPNFPLTDPSPQTQIELEFMERRATFQLAVVTCHRAQLRAAHAQASSSDSRASARPDPGPTRLLEVAGASDGLGRLKYRDSLHLQSRRV